MKHFVLLIVVLASVSSVVYLVSPIGLDAFSFSHTNSQQTDSLTIPPLDSTTGGEDSHARASSEGTELVLMKFGAPWCPPCRMVDKELRKLGNSDLPVKIRKINVDDQPDLADQYRVNGIPRLILLQDGKKIGDLVGYKSAAELSDWIKDSASEAALAAKKRPSGPATVHANPFFH